MKYFDKIVWTEGMFLRPHHFQEMENYFEERQWILRSREHFFGFLKIKLDNRMLTFGKFSILSAFGVFQDGTIFYCDEFENVLTPLKVLSKDIGKIIYLSLPIKRLGKKETIFLEDSNSLARYLAFKKKVFDHSSLEEDTFNKVKKIYCAKLRLKITFKDKLNEDHLFLGVAKIKNINKNGEIILDEYYIPPLIESNASYTLEKYKYEIFEILMKRKKQIISYFYKQEFKKDTKHDLINLMLLSLINKFIAKTQYIINMPRIHPEKIFLYWISLLMELSVFYPPYDVDERIPKYNHCNIGKSFQYLVKNIRKKLFYVLKKDILNIKFTEIKDSRIKYFQFPESNMQNKYNFILAIKKNNKQPLNKVQILSKIKIAPFKKIKDLVKLQLPGISIRVVSKVPSQIVIKKNWNYFLIEDNHPFWKEINNDNLMSIHLSKDIYDIPLNLWAILKK